MKTALHHTFTLACKMHYRDRLLLFCYAPLLLSPYSDSVLHTPYYYRPQRTRTQRPRRALKRL